MHEKVCENRFKCEGFPAGKGWGKDREVSGTLLTGDNGIFIPFGITPGADLGHQERPGDRVSECLGSPLPPAHSPGFTLGQLEPEVAFKQLD